MGRRTFLVVSDCTNKVLLSKTQPDLRNDNLTIDGIYSRTYIYKCRSGKKYEISGNRGLSTIQRLTITGHGYTELKHHDPNWLWAQQ